MAQEIKLRITERSQKVPLGLSRDAPPVSLSLEQVRTVIQSDYDKLKHKPKIEGVELQGDKSFRQLGLNGISESDIDSIIFGGN